MTDYYFWFAQPSSILNNYDKSFFYAFSACVVLAVVLFVARLLIQHKIVKGVLARLVNLFLTTGLSGVIWFAFRYENTPIFAKRFWAGLVVAMGLVWLFFVLKYLVLRFPREKKEYEANLIKSKYLPGAR